MTDKRATRSARRDATRRHLAWSFVAILILAMPGSAFGQGSVFGTVQNSDLNNPAAGQLFWIGFLDDTDEEIRIESNTGAGYDGVNWYDDFQNYTTEAAGNPYDYFFIDVVNGEGHHLAGSIPSNSFQQENVLLAVGTFPGRPSGLLARVPSSSRINLTWEHQSGVTYHVYRRVTSNNGLFKRMDDPTGNLANAGVADSFFVDVNSDGASSYTYIIMGEDASGNYSAHSAEITILASAVTGPMVTAVVPDSGSAVGMPAVTVQGSNFDVAGATVTFGGIAATNVVVANPFELTCNVPTGTPGTMVDVVVTNTDAALSSAPLVGGFRYLGNSVPVLAAIGAQAVDEAQNLNFGVSATDTDGDSLILSAVNVPANATFTDNFNGTGTFDFNPDFAQAGVYNVEFIASDGTLADTEIVAITVNDINRAPALFTIGSKTVDEGQNLAFDIGGDDPDLDSLILTAESIPVNATFTDHYDGIGTFDFDPDFTQSGAFTVTFIVSDGALADTEVVTITVNDVNLAPVLAPIGAQVVDEGQNLNLLIAASDFDLDSIILTAENLPPNATFVDNFDSTGTFDFNPDFLQAGIHNVTFIASDGALADTEVVAITVNDAGNQAPVLTAIGPQTVAENQNLNVAVTASDPDADSLILSAENLPPNATFVDNFDGTGVFDFNPDFTQAGPYDITFIASDGLLADTEIVAVTVTEAGNQRPVIDPIADTTVAENVLLAFGMTASDADGDSLVLSTANLPANASFTDIGDGTGVFDFTPDFTQAGLYNVSFIASDGTLADTDIVAITVTNSNEPPALAPIGSQIVDEGQNLNIVVSAVDPEADSVILTALDVPANATFTDNFDGTGIFDFTPDFTQSGAYDVTFIASDTVLADTEIVTITVNEVGNQAPTIAPVADTAIDENTVLTIAISATEPDGDSLILSAIDLPANATFTDNFDGTGSFAFAPSFFQANIYSVTFIASDALLADSAIVEITVNNVNQLPILDPIGPLSVLEGDTLSMVMTASDADSVIPSIVGENLPVGAVLTDSANGVASLFFAPQFNQAGLYQVLFIASDGVDADSELVDLTVVDGGNQPPVLDPIGPQVVMEGETLAIHVIAVDPDSTAAVLTAENLPPNAVFVDSANGAAGFVFTPDFNQGGNAYQVTFIANDGTVADTEIVLITVTEIGNLSPVFDTVPPQTVAEGDSLVVLVHAVDPEGTAVEMGTLTPVENGVFVDSGNGFGTLTLWPNFMQSGEDTVRILALDGEPLPASSTLMILITITETNLPPYLQPIGDYTILAGDSLRLRIVATDTTAPPGNEIVLATLGAPANSTFQDSGNGIGGFVFKPTFDQIGLHSMKFIATDNGDPAMATVENVVLAVQNQNRPPEIDPIGPQSVDEGDTLVLLVTAYDPDGMIPFLTADPLPTNAAFVDSGNGVGVFTFMPDYLQAGLFNVTFTAGDGLLTDKETVLIQVRDAGNQPPEFDPMPPSASVTEWETLTLVVSATDPENQALALSVTPPIEYATFVDSGNGIGVYELVPDFWQDGTYDLVFLVEDTEGGADTANVTLTVNDAGNQTPFFLPIDGQTGQETILLEFTVTASDTDRTVPSLDARPLPANAAFLDHGDGTGTFTMTPDYTQAGDHEVYFVAFDEEDITLVDSVLVPITVLDFNQRPRWDSTSTLSQTVYMSEGDSVTIWHAFSDPDGTVPVLSVEDPPSPNMSWVDSNDGFIWITFTPDYNDRGGYTVGMTATDADYDTASIAHFQTFNVGAVNLAPEIDTILPQSVLEGETLEFIVTAIDGNGTFPTMSAYDLPPNATFTSLGSGTGQFTFNPTLMQAGVYYPSFTAADYLVADTMQVEITVVELGNQAPVWMSPFPPETDTVALTVYSDVQMHVWATDIDNLTLTLTAEDIPLNAAFADSGNMAGLFTFAPDSSQLDAYFAVTFIAADTSLADTAIVHYTVMGFMRGDWNYDGLLDVIDVVNLVNHAFRSGPPPVPVDIGDINIDGVIDVLDVVLLADHVFRGGPAPQP